MWGFSTITGEIVEEKLAGEAIVVGEQPDSNEQERMEHAAVTKSAYQKDLWALWFRVQG